jgi:hypothetical protein
VCDVVVVPRKDDDDATRLANYRRFFKITQTHTQTVRYIELAKFTGGTPPVSMDFSKSDSSDGRGTNQPAVVEQEVNRAPTKKRINSTVIARSNDSRIGIGYRPCATCTLCTRDSSEGVMVLWLPSQRMTFQSSEAQNSIPYVTDWHWLFFKI